MADTVQISRLSSTLDECLSKIERLGVSLKDLKSNEAVLAEFESALDDIQKKKDALLGSSAADSVKQQVGDLMGKLQDAMGSGANLSSLFGSINRIRDLARGGGESLPSFSPSARARYQDVSDSYAAAGFGRGGAPQSGLVRNVRSVITDVPSGTSASYGGMNAFMSTRALAMGNALSGYSVRESSRSLSQQLADETQSDAMEDSVATIQRTSDEILDALQRPREAKGSVKEKTTVKREVQKRDSGFTWGGLLKTIGTVGLIGGALFGALGSETVSQWLVDMTDPKKREEWINKQKKWFEDKWAEFEPKWDSFTDTLSKVWDTVSKLGAYFGGTSVGDVNRLGETLYEGTSSSFTPQEHDYIGQLRDAELQQRPIEVAGVSGGTGARLSELASKGLTVAGGWFVGKKVTVAFLKSLYQGTSLALEGEAAAALGVTGTALVGAAAVAALFMGIAGSLKDDADREMCNAASAKAALELGLPYFIAYVKGGGNMVQPVPFFRLSDGNGKMYGASLSDEAQRGLMTSWLTNVQQLTAESNKRALLDASVVNLRSKMSAAELSKEIPGVTKEAFAAREARRKELESLYNIGMDALNDGSASVIDAALAMFETDDAVVPFDKLSYGVVDLPNVSAALATDGSTGSSSLFGSSGPLVFVGGVTPRDSRLPLAEIEGKAKQIPLRDPTVSAEVFENLPFYSPLKYNYTASKWVDGFFSWLGVDSGLVSSYIKRFAPPLPSVSLSDSATPWKLTGGYWRNWVYDMDKQPVSPMMSPPSLPWGDQQGGVSEDSVEAIANRIMEKFESRGLVTDQGVVLNNSVNSSSTVHVKGSTNDQQQGFQ